MRDRGEEGEVDVDSVDWLTGSYKLKSEVEEIPVITGKSHEEEKGLFSNKRKIKFITH